MWRLRFTEFMLKEIFVKAPWRNSKKAHNTNSKNRVLGMDMLNAQLQMFNNSKNMYKQIIFNHYDKKMSHLQTVTKHPQNNLCFLRGKVEVEVHSVAVQSKWMIPFFTHPVRTSTWWKFNLYVSDCSQILIKGRKIKLFCS